MKKPTIPAIPTTYAGVNFRSRLEAKWAAFFDIVAWQWDYDGNHHIDRESFDRLGLFRAASNAVQWRPR